MFTNIPQKIRLFSWITLVFLLCAAAISPPSPRSHTRQSANRHPGFRPAAFLGELPCDPTTGTAGPFPCQNIDMVGYLPANIFGGLTTADIWGWTDPETGREYALVSHSMATTFIDVSDPSNPVFVGELPAPVPNVLWRDVKVYKDHAYIVGDGDFVLPHGIQIFDLTQLRDVSDPPVVFSPTTRYLGVGNTHNFAVNEATGTGVAVGSNTCSGGLHMIDLNDPANPVFLGCFSADGYTHDVQCVVYHGPDLDHQGREICMASNEDTLTIVDITDKTNPVMLARQGYAGSSYTHQGSLTEDHAFFILGDELDEQDNGHNTRSYLWDVRDLDAPIQFSIYEGPTTAIDHNLFVVGSYVFEANYTAGLRVLNASNIAGGELTEAAYFDTHPTNNVAEFAGAWSNYPFFASGIVIVSNIEDGLYILRPDLPGYPEPETTEVQATGGGWLAAHNGKKINFGFNAGSESEPSEGNLQLNDRFANVKISIDTWSGLAEGSAACAGLSGGESVGELIGEGTFNGQAAGFRVCAADNGEPGQGSDAFYLECTTGCTYATSDSAADAVIDGGNIQITADPVESAESPEATVLILDPLLQIETFFGQPQVFSITVYDQFHNPMTDISVSLEQIDADGTTSLITGLTGPDGTVQFTLVQAFESVEYAAAADSVESNRIELKPVLP